MSEFKLRDYQESAATAAVDFFRKKGDKNAIMCLPTGSGKSLVIAEIAYRLEEPVIIFQPSKEILEQNFAKLQSYGIFNCSVYSASLNSKEISKITFATIGSVRSCPELFVRFKYVIIDECHLVNPKQGMYKDFLEFVKCKTLGLTATPYRLHSDGFGGSILKFITRTRPKVFNEMIYQVQIDTLLNRGYLSKLEYYSIKTIDSSRLVLNSTGADYTDASVRNAYRAAKFENSLEGIVRRLIAAGRENILVFTRFVEEAEYIAKQIGECASIVSGETPKKEREQILSNFKSGKIKVVANVGVLTTGFDFPELSTIVLARPTMSLALYYQMVGRAIRPHKNKPAGWIVDLCDNVQRFGKVEDLKLEAPKPGLWAVYSQGRQLTNVYY